jgi:hypothetical protein
MSADVVLVEHQLRLLAARLPDDLALPVVSIRRGTVRLESAAAFGNVQHAVGRVSKLASTHDLYVAPGAIPRPRLRQLKDAGKRGGRADVAALVGLWLDLDVAGPTHAALNLPPTDGDARWIVDQLPAPSMALATGGGWQCWWLFDRPLDCASSNRLAADRLARSWQRLGQSVADEHGWHVDDTGDLARILRVSGSRNHKHEAPVLVEPVDDLWRPELRYEPNDLAAFVAQRLPEIEQEHAQAAAEIAAPAAQRHVRRTGVLDVVDRLPWHRIWPSDWTQVQDADVRGGRVELWRRPGASSRHSVTCWSDGGCYVHSAAVPGLEVGPHSRAEVLAWSLGMVDVGDLVHELRRREHEERRRR